MINLKVGDIVVYENRECRITKLTDNEAELVNLHPKNENDWAKVRVLITDIEEDTKNE